jgi:glycerol-3-phosphate dehydrogenase subunit C
MKIDKRIAYFAGCMANFVDPEVGKSVIQVLKRCGFQPIVPGQICCGIPQLAVGNLSKFLKHAEFNVCSLIEADCDIVTACTSCALAVKLEYPKYLESKEAEEISKRIYDIMEYLVKLRTDNMLNINFQPLNLSLLYYAPCHLKIIQGESIDERLELMRLIPGLSVNQIESGCCGMGGTFGAKRRNYTKSMMIGKNLFEGIIESAPDMVATDCPGCKLQIQQGTGLRVIHPIDIIKQAYGL